MLKLQLTLNCNNELSIFFHQTGYFGILDFDVGGTKCSGNRSKSLCFFINSFDNVLEL